MDVHIAGQVTVELNTVERYQSQGKVFVKKSPKQLSRSNGENILKTLQMQHQILDQEVEVCPKYSTE